jgi:hypothetical protein
MTLGELKELLPFYVAGTLEPEEKKLVEEALSQSKELQEELDDWKAMQLVVKADAAYQKAGHLSTEETIYYIEDSSRINQVRLSEIETHLQNCDSCNSEIEILQATYPKQTLIKNIAEHLQKLVDAVRELSRPARIAYAIPVLAAAVVIAVLLIRPMFSPTAELVPFTLTDQSLTRSGTRGTTTEELSTLTLKSKIRKINMIFILQKSGIQGVRYTLSLEPTRGKAIALSDTIVPVISDLNVDTLKFSLDRTTFGATEGKYQLNATEVLPDGSVGEAFHQQFNVVISKD